MLSCHAARAYSSEGVISCSSSSIISIQLLFRVIGSLTGSSPSSAAKKANGFLVVTFPIEEGRFGLDVRLENSLWHHPSSVFVTFGNFGLAFGFGSLTSREELVGDGWKKRHWGPFLQHPLRKKWQALRVFMFRFSVFVVGWGGLSFIHPHIVQFFFTF